MTLSQIIQAAANDDTGYSAATRVVIKKENGGVTARVHYSDGGSNLSWRSDMEGILDAMFEQGYGDLIEFAD